MNEGFHDLLEVPEKLEIISEYEKNVHKMLYQTEAGKKVMEHWKENLIKRPSVRMGQQHDLIDVGICVGYDNHKRDLLHIVDKINEGEK